jgi:RHS repeat-associated protein
VRTRLARLVGLAVAAAASLALPASAQVVEYYHLDAIGNVRAVSNQAGAIIERHDFLPYGEECTTSPCNANPVGTNTRKFTGKERDAESGLDYFGARYYRSGIGRFVSVDPVISAKRAVFDPQLWQRYSYVHNRPLQLVDPDGREAMLYTANGWQLNPMTGEYSPIPRVGARQAVLEGAMPAAVGLGVYALAMSPALAPYVVGKAMMPGTQHFALEMLEGILNPGPSASLPGPRAREMLPRLIDVLKKFEGTPAAKADVFERGASIITRVAIDDWSAVRRRGIDGSYIFTGEGAQARMFVIDSVGTMYLGSSASLKSSGNGLVPVYEALKKVE